MIAQIGILAFALVMYVLTAMAFIPILGAILNGKWIGVVDFISYVLIAVCTAFLGTFATLWWEDNLRNKRR